VKEGDETIHGECSNHWILLKRKSSGSASPNLEPSIAREATELQRRGAQFASPTIQDSRLGVVRCYWCLENTRFSLSARLS